MSKWKDSLDDTVTPEQEEKVLRAMRPLLKQNAELAAGDRARPGWYYWVLPALALGAVAIALLPRGPAATPLPPEFAEKLDIALDYDLYLDLREIQNLDTLQKLGDPDRWPTKKPKPPKS